MRYIRAYSLGRNVGTLETCSEEQRIERALGVVFEDAIPVSLMMNVGMLTRAHSSGCDRRGFSWNEWYAHRCPSLYLQ